jgi:hypothetical protein
MDFDTSNIVGRNAEIEMYFSILDSQSIVLSSHRRMGKTMVLKKMTTEHPEDYVPIFFIVEGKSNPEEFIHDLYLHLKKENLITEDKTSRILQWYEKNFAGKEIKDMKLPTFRPHWKEAMRNLVEDLVEKNVGKSIVIMIDEFPMMLYKFIKEYGLYREAIEMLDSLREIRQLYNDKGIKFIFCGSIGLNIVLEILKKEYKYAGEPINDMILQILDAMSPTDALDLVEHLVNLKAINIEGGKNEIYSTICSQVDNLPFYIDLVIKEVELHHESLSKESIINEVEKLISSPGNQGQFNHFYDRINTYYDPEIKIVALHILNWLSKQSGFKSEEEIYNVIASIIALDKEIVKLVLKRLFDDLYLDRFVSDGIRSFKFRYSLLKRWWLVNLS